MCNENRNNERFTGLDVLVVLIAFIVVASVFFKLLLMPDSIQPRT
jgi:hypothetical protein